MWIDDCISELEPYKVFLELEEHYITTSSNPSIFEALLKESKFDFIILDVMMNQPYTESDQKYLSKGNETRFGLSYYLPIIKNGIIPFIIFTNVPLCNLENEFQNELKAISHFKGYCYKPDFNPEKLIEKLNQ